MHTLLNGTCDDISKGEEVLNAFIRKIEGCINPDENTVEIDRETLCILSSLAAMVYEAEKWQKHETQILREISKTCPLEMFSPELKRELKSWMAEYENAVMQSRELYRKLECYKKRRHMA